jgi:hypothetical protein
MVEPDIRYQEVSLGGGEDTRAPMLAVSGGGEGGGGEDTGAPMLAVSGGGGGGRSPFGVHF